MIENISDFILNLLPGNIFFYIYYLVFIFFLSLLLIFYFSKKAKKKSKTPKQKEITLYDLFKIVSSSKSKIDDLLFALNYFAENFSVDMNKNVSIKFLKKILNHKNRQKVLFDVFYEKIIPKNLKYKKELDKIEKEALNNEIK